MSNTDIQNFESALKKSFNKYLKQKPTQAEAQRQIMEQLIFLEECD